MKKILSVILACTLIAGVFAGCSSQNTEFDDWQSAGDAELGSIDESAQKNEVVDDFSESYGIDDVLNLTEFHDKVHYADLNLFVDEYNSTLLEHQAKMTFRDYSKGDGNIEDLETTYNHLGIVKIHSEDEIIKKVTSKFTASMSVESQTVYAVNLIYHTVPNATKKRLTQIYDGISQYMNGSLKQAPNYIIDNYSISVEANSSNSGFTLTILAIN